MSKVAFFIKMLWTMTLLCSGLAFSPRTRISRPACGPGRVLRRMSDTGDDTSSPEDISSTSFTLGSGLPSTAAEAWRDPRVQAKAREILMQKYRDLGKDEQYSLEEVESFLSDETRSGEYCYKIAIAGAPGTIADPSELLPYIGIFLVGFFGSGAARYFSEMGGQ